MSTPPKIASGLTGLLAVALAACNQAPPPAPADAPTPVTAPANPPVGMWQTAKDQAARIKNTYDAVRHLQPGQKAESPSPLIVNDAAGDIGKATQPQAADTAKPAAPQGPAKDAPAAKAKPAHPA